MKTAEELFELLGREALAQEKTKKARPTNKCLGVRGSPDPSLP